MEEPNFPPGKEGRKSGDKRLPTMGNSVLWYLIAIALLIMLLVMWFRQDSSAEIPYGRLEELIRKGYPGSEEKSVEVAVAGTTEKRYKYWGLSDLRVGQFEVTGKVHRKLIGATASVQPEVVRFRTPTLGVQAEGEVGKLLSANGFRDFNGEEAPSGWRTYAPMLILTILLVVFFIFMLRRLGGAGSPMAFGRSRGKLYFQEDIGVTFEDVAGVDEAVEELKEVVEFLRTPERYQVVGGRIPKGILLVGPPGTGKTLLAKAVAGEAGVPFFSLSGSDFVEMFVGVGAARVRDMFQQAEAKSPCIIFIDELDALGKTRGTSIVGGHDEREQTLNALLVEMDGFNSNAGIIVLAATNRPETLDPALLRPGRFDRQVLVDRPDVRGREAILRVHVKNVKLDPSVSLKEIAQMTPSFVGADLANLVNEAALLAGRKRKSAVGMEEFNEGIERVIAGLEKKQRVIHPDEKQRVAYHESGHALVACSLPNTASVKKVSIIPRGIAGGFVLQRPEEDRYTLTSGELESQIAVALGGTVAEETVYGEISTGALNDLERATDVARRMVMEFGMSRLGRVYYRESPRSMFLPGAGDLSAGRMHSEHTLREIDQEVKRIIDEQLQRARAILQARRPTLEAIARRLMEKEVIDDKELREIIDAHSSGPWVVPGTAERKRLPEPAEVKPPAEGLAGAGGT